MRTLGVLMERKLPRLYKWDINNMPFVRICVAQVKVALWSPTRCVDDEFQ
jgi:hypothetical protein